MRWRIVMIVALLVAAAGCVRRLHRETVQPNRTETVDRRAPFLKVHMRSGSLYVLSPWSVDEPTRRVRGTGTLYDMTRVVVDRGTFAIAIDSVALFETNVVRPSPSVAVLSVITGITAAITAVCIADPKTCFGSCPTFYASDGHRDILQAEGFSASVAPSLEATDVDALYRLVPAGNEVRIRMVNEAYETHVVRWVDLLAVPREPGMRIMMDDAGTFWHTTAPVPAVRCRAPEGDCAEVVAAFDERERTSQTDSADLSARETVDLWFPAAETPGLVLASRQSLLPTYLLYQAFAYMGTSVGEWLARLERADQRTAAQASRVVATLGGIDVFVARDGRWDSVTTVYETGPLASDLRVVPLPVTGKSPVHVRLRMARGAWRLDHAALVSLRHAVAAHRLRPVEVTGSEGPDPEAHRALRDSSAVLVTFPGDEYTLAYHLPTDGTAYEVFLESRGYYLEWMRQEWIAEENAALAAALFLDPAGSLRRLAPAFKRVEPDIEAAFWGSKYVNR